MLPYFSVKEFLLGSVIMLILIITCMDLLRKIKFGRKYATNTPMVSYIPLIGSVYVCLLGEPLDLSLDLCKNYKSCYLWIFTKPYYMTCDPDDIQIILNHRYTIEKGSAYSVLKSVFREAIIISPETVWRKTRKLISKLFKQNVINTFIPLFNEMGDEYVEAVEKEENTADLEKKNTEFFINTFSYNFLKYDPNEKLDKLLSEFSFHEAPKILTDSVLCRMLNPLYYFDCIYKLTPGGIAYFRTIEQSAEFCTEIIHSRREKRMDPGFSEEIDGLSLIDLFDDSGEDFQNIISQITFIGGAAGETSGKVLTYAMAVLGLYKDIQEKVYEEVINVTGNDGMIDGAAINKMKYTKMVFFETMRMFTPVPMILRQVTEDLELKGRTIPKGTNIIVHLMALHRNEEHWKDPMSFDPNKFSAEEVKNRHPYSFAPFSAGPRNCIGWKYANMIGVTIIGKIVRKYKISSSLKSLEEIKLKSFVLLNVPKDIRVTFTPRTID